jgi:ABC-2 type transport system ATP-binding protein
MLLIEGLRKRFGEVQALDGVSLQVKPGEVFGFLGSNGAGKTTTMRIVLGLMKADEGAVTWDGCGPLAAAARRDVTGRGSRPSAPRPALMTPSGAPA